MKRYFLITAIIFFVIGVTAGNWMCLRNPIPKAIMIKLENGKELGQAWTDPSLLKIITLKDGDNPGSFLAMPIYGLESKTE